MTPSRIAAIFPCCAVNAATLATRASRPLHRKPLHRKPLRRPQRRPVPLPPDRARKDRGQHR